jgi:ferrochelatase
VVELPRWLWLPLLNLVILPLRAPRSAHAYSTVWTPQGSPLLAHTLAQARGLEGALGADTAVVAAMRYGEPSIERGLSALCERGCERVVVVPAFPQYSSATTGSVLEECFRVLSARRVVPSLAVVPPYPDDPGYVAALAAVARAATAGAPVDHWVLSFHGIPVRYARAGDPYPQHCERTARALAQALGLPAGSWSLAYQSRFGREPWLEPATDRLVVDLAGRAKRVAVVVPGFVADCLETLEEIGVRLREDFVRAGGSELVLVPALNADPAWIAAMAGLVRGSAGGGLSG